MKQKNLLILAAVAVVLLGAGIWLSAHRGQQGTLGGGAVFPDLKPALGEVSEIELAELAEQRVLVREMAVQDGRRVLDLLRQLAHRHRFVAALGEQFACCVEDLRSKVLTFALSPFLNSHEALQ